MEEIKRTSERESALRSSWKEVLETNKEPEDFDNFVQSGGDSISAVYLVSLLRRRCAIDISIVDVHKNQTYADFKNSVRKACPLKEETTPITEPANPNRQLHLSSAQQLIVNSQQTPESTAYVETIAFWTSKAIDPKEIIFALLRRHPMLKSKITINNESLEYSSTIEKDMDIDVNMEIVDSSEVSEAYLKQTTPIISVIDSSLVKARFVMAKEHSVLVLHVHHVIVDDVTLSNIAGDIEQLLHDCAPNENKLSPCQHYADYIEQEKAYLKSTKCEEDEEFWKKSFASLPPESNLAISPRTQRSMTFETRVYSAKHSTRTLSAEAADGIAAYCRVSGLTEFQYFLGCTVLVLQRYLGVGEVTLAVPVTTRTENHGKTDGMFVNTVLCRIYVDYTSTMKEHIDAVAAQWLEALRHSHYPFQQVTKALWTTHRNNYSLFCSVMFNYAVRNRKANELSVSAKDAKMPFSLDVIKDSQSNQTAIIAEWADQLIDDGVAERLTDSVFQLCSRAYIENTKSLKKIQVLATQEHDLLDSFNTNSAVSADFRIEACLPVHTRFEHFAKTSPNSTAVAINDRRLSYRQLNELSSKVANALSDRIKEDKLKNSPVVIVAKKDEYAIAAILGVWKAGGHFLPVATTNQNSVESILNRNQPAAILTNLPHNSLIVNENNNQRCPLFSIENLINNSPNEFNETRPKTAVQDLAYIIQTSGSTGTPKQCKISHRSLHIIANAWLDRYAMREFNVNVLQWAPLSFDVFVGDVVRALVSAPGQLTICPDERRLDIPYILQLIKKHQITMAEVTPLFGQQLVENSSQDELNSVKIFILGSDVLQRHVYRTIKAKLRKDQRLLNSYGMTEATIDSSFFERDTLPVTRSDTVPIGTPLPGVGLHVLDPKTFLPCPVGTVGELYITGEILASGDVNLLEVAHLGCRALKTGDAACWLPSGDVELIGRMDNVVKLRGFRISTAEIENKIVEMVDAVTQACVVPLRDQKHTVTMNEFLCAFVVLDHKSCEGIKIDKNHVCNKLKGALPYYMLPDIVQVIKKIPISTNGKVDHKALPAVSELLETTTRPAPERPSQESLTSTTLKALFAEVLGLPDSEQVDKKLTFMEQGAHSLILVKFSTLIAQKTSFGVTIADIFSYPTISALEEYITQETQYHDDVDPQVSNATMAVSTSNNESEDVAITGIGLRLPGNIMTLPQLWEVLESGHDLIGDFSETRSKDVFDCLSQENKETLSKAETFQGVFFKRIDEFDNEFFKISPGEAKCMSPEQRMFLQVATEALAESKLLSEVHGSNIGVFVGSSEIGYSQLCHPNEATCMSGLLPGMIATRVAYQWDLKGPTMLVDTACSSSLMALKEACESIKRGECEGALVGGVYLLLYPSRTGDFGKDSTLSPDFKCRPFDKDSTGMAVGEGVMCLYAETLEKAIREKKPIYGIVKGMASNNVGRGNRVGSPSAISQRSAIQDTLNNAKVQPSEVTFLEANGTGTQLGDKIELSALRSVFKDTRESEIDLSIGSVKSVFGHLGPAAGMLGVFKTLAALESKKIPPTAHFKTPHPELIHSRMNVPNETIQWHPSSTESRRIAGVNSIGFTNTNCHAIIAEGPRTESDNITGQRKYPLLIAGSNLEQIRRQLHLHKIHIRQSILKSGASNYPGMCLTVARRLKEFVKLKVNIELKLVITAKDLTQILEAVEAAQAVTDLRAMIQLARLSSDIDFCCPQYGSEVKSASPDIASFLQHGTINLDGLFHGDSESLRLTLGVTLVVYNESRHWLEPCKRISRGSSRLDVGELLGVKLNETRELVRNLPLAPADDLEVTLGTFCSTIIIKLFLSTALSKNLANDLEITLKNAFALSEMLPKYEKFFFVLVRELWRNNLLDATGEDKTIHCLESFVFKCRHLLDTDPTAIANHAIKKYPSWADCFRFPLYCSQHLAKVVRGNMSPLSVIYPRGDLNFTLQFDKLGDLLGDVYCNMYMQLIASYATQLSGQGKQVRILEVGVGVGHVTRQILPKLKDTANVEYWFTDQGKAFVEHAKTTFADYLHMTKFATFDINKSAPMQGLLGSFDIIVSYNAIFTMQNILDSVVNLKSCLNDDGKLFIIESVKNKTWATLAWGILDSWWNFNDYDLREAEPKMEAEKWKRVLQTAGFQSIITCPNQNDEENHVEKFMFLCSENAATSSGKSLQFISNPGWWETDRFDPKRKLEDSQDEVDGDNARTLEGEMAGKHSVYEELKKIWSELFGQDNIDSKEDFNSLGGESFLAIKMINLVKKRINFQLEIVDTFRYPTLGSLASFITTELKKDTKVEVAICDVSKSNQQFEDPSNKNNHYYKGFQPSNLPKATTAVQEKGTLLMFPGQGSASVGMCFSLKDSIEARKVFHLAEKVLGYNVLDICLGDEITLEEKLKSTEFVQVALFVGCLAKIEQIKAEKPNILAKVTHVTGLCIGEFAALVYAGVVGFQDALKLVYERGKAMEKILMETPTGMVSISGPRCKQLKTLLEQNHPSMIISTYLADNQHAVVGTDQQCDAFVESLSGQHKEYMNVVDVRRIPATGAFHSPYMDKASKQVDNLITGMEFSKPSLPIIMNVSGDIATDPLEIKKFLREQLTTAVRWKQSVITAHALGIRSFIEVAPRRVLSSIVKKRIKECQGCDVEYIQV